MSETLQPEAPDYQPFALRRTAGEHRRCQGKCLWYSYEVAWSEIGDQIIWAMRVTQSGAYKGESSGSLAARLDAVTDGAVIAAVCRAIDDLHGIAE